MAASQNVVEHALRRAAEDLGAVGARWALIGGFAVSARAEPRTTRDVDIAVDARSDRGAEQLVFDLRARGYRLVTLLEQRRTGRIATARLEHRDRPGVFVDLLFGSSGIEREIVRSADRLEAIPGLVVPVAAVGHLVAMKVLARDDRRRPQDAADLRALLAIASASERGRARRAVEAITRRGFARKRDLRAGLARALRDAQRAR